MIETACLSRAELVELTGRQHADSQAAWLVARGWPFQLDADGRPKVARAEWERRMLSGVARINAPRRPASPRLDRVR